MTVTFFGHRDAPEDILPRLKEIIAGLIEKEGTISFLVGNEGAFDSMVSRSLIELSEVYPQIRYSVVLAYLPKATATEKPIHPTVYPEGLETVPPRFAISKRNLWMLNQAETIIVFVTVPMGNSFRLMKQAKAKRKTVINIADYL